MKKSDLTYINIDSVGEVITNYDTKDIPDRYAIDAKGVRLGKEGMVLQRYWGTKKLYDNVPTKPATGTIVGGHRFYNKDTDSEIDIIVTTDSTGTAYTRIYANDSTLASANVGTANNWIELKRAFTAVVDGTPGATTDTTVDLKEIKDSLGSSYTLSTHELKYFICLNVDLNVAALVVSSTATQIGIPNYAGNDGLKFLDGHNLVFFRTTWAFNNFYKAKTTEWSGTDINMNLGASPHNRWLPVEAQKKVNLALGNTSTPPTMRNLMRLQVNNIKNLFHDGSGYGLSIPANWDINTVGGLITHYDSNGSEGTPITVEVTDETVTIENDTNADGTAGAPFMQFVYDVTHTALLGGIDTHLRFAVTLEFDNYQESDPIYKGFFQCPADYVPAVVINSVSINPATMPKNLTAINFYCATHSNSLTAVQWLDKNSDYALHFSLPINSDTYTALGESADYSGAGVRWDLVETSQYCYSLVCGTSISLGSGASYQVGEIYPQAVEIGSGYTVGDILTLTGGSDDATVQVDSVHPSTNSVISVSLVTPGTSGFEIGLYETTGGTGTGAKILVTKLSPKYNTSTSGTLAGRLAHATDTTRTLITPRFLTKSARNQAAIHVLDRDESTLMFSCYNGSAAHEDDNIPNIAADSSGNRQLIALNGKGVMRGLEITRDIITVLRSTEAETFDLQTGVQQLFDIDFLASASLVKSPYGLTWAGRTGIWFMPENGSSLRQINLKWANKYDGSMMIDDGITSYVTDTYRSAIVSGYDPYTKAVVFCIQTNKHDTGSEYVLASYEFEYDRWSFKVLGGSIIPKFFAKTTKISTADSARLIIGTTGSLLRYPNIGGTFPYQDSETAASAAGSGFETSITINLKSLYNQIENANLVCFLIDQSGSSIDGVGLFTVEFYANDETSAFDTQYVPIDEIPEIRNIEARGNLDSLRIKLSLPSATLSNFKKWDVSRIILGFMKNIRKGTI